MEVDEVSQKKQKKQVYLPVLRGLKPNEEWEVDESAYRLYHSFETGHPCLSFDTLLDAEVTGRKDEFPLNCFLVAGTQAENPRHNAIMVIRLENLHGNKESTQNDEESASQSSSSEDEENDASGLSKKPLFRSVNITHHGGINRIRATTIGSATICATWNDRGKVHLWNLTTALRALQTLSGSARNQSESVSEKPLFTFADHHVEGFAMDWSTISLGRFASGDIHGRVHVWSMSEGGAWAVNSTPYRHNSSVEDIQWSPSEQNAFASCSADKSIRLWDARCAVSEAQISCVENAHDSDVNVISWNSIDHQFLVSGADDGTLKIWDLRFVQSNMHPVATFNHHKAAVTSVQWCPYDSSSFAACGEDDQLTLWDLAVEPDTEEMAEADDVDVPPQLLFIHQGQKEIKELRWHPQSTGVLLSTALDDKNTLLVMNFLVGNTTTSDSVSGANANTAGQSLVDRTQLYEWILQLSSPKTRETALLELSKKRESVPDLAPLLWHSFGTIAALLQEIISIYPSINPPTLTAHQSNRVCNALALMQCVASHQDTRSVFLQAHIPLFLYPFLHTTSKTRPFEYLRLTSLGVIGALVKTDEHEVIQFLLTTEIIPLCLRIMENGSELSKTVATFILQKILLDETGLNYICQTYDRFSHVAMILGKMVLSLAKEPSARLLKHVIRCYSRLSDNTRAREALRQCLPDQLKSPDFVVKYMKDDRSTQHWLAQLLMNVEPGSAAGGPSLVAPMRPHS